MAQLIQAQCPRCKNILRMPADWLGQPMRCKHCGQVFQPRLRSASAPPPSPAGVLRAQPRSSPPAAVPVAAPAVPPPGSPFAFDVYSDTVSRPRRHRKSNWWKGALFGLVVLTAAALAGIFAGPPLLERLSGPGAADKRPSQSSKLIASAPPADTTRTEPKGKPPTPQTSKKTTPKNTERPRPKATKKERPRTTEIALKKDTQPMTRPSPKKKGPVAVRFPRRALAISVCEYWLANPLGYGRPREANFPGSSTGAVLKALGNFNLRFPNTQLGELSDQGLEPQPPLKEVIEGTVVDFLNTSRPEDRIVLLFAGHATEIDKQAYLVPVLGDLKDAKTLIPLSWIYDRLKECKARQKVLILDVCRFDPARGMERPGSEKMGPVLDAALQAPPPGVQVWSSCILGQNSYEFESGSLFLQALCAALNERLPGLQEPTMPLPLDVLVPRVNQYLAKSLAMQKLEQVSRLSGQEMQGGATYNPDDPLPPPVAIHQPPSVGDPASAMQVQKILEEIAAVPSPRVGRPGVHPHFNLLKSLPLFSAKDLEPYKADYRSWEEFANEADKYPLRAAVVRAVKVLQQNASKFAMKEYFGGATTAAVKKAVLKEQAAPGKAILALEEALDDLQKAGEKKVRKKEKSLRWQANYDFVVARLKARLVYLYQYNYVLAKIRGDSLPPLEDGFSGYRLGSLKKVTVPESKVKAWVKDIDRTWQKIINDYPHTPWELIARRERLTALGLDWRPSRE
jgi:hypothetical protein